jgi:16S rRNA (guanine966-N2)-methyltransferase
MRVVAGRHRGRRLAAPEGRALRPTADRVRESVFNILAHGGFGAGGASVLAGACVLDAFAGTGAMGIEALSRGAAHATFLENDPAALAALRANLAMIGERANATVLTSDALHPPRAAAPVTVAFLDPPYHEGLGPAALSALSDAGWFAPGAIVTLEVAAREAFTPPAGFAVLDERRYGAARIVVLRAPATPPLGRA